MPTSQSVRLRGDVTVRGSSGGIGKSPLAKGVGWGGVPAVEGLNVMHPPAEQSKIKGWDPMG